MAMTYQNFASLGVNLNRQKYGPLDISNVFTSAADLKYYLTKGTFTEGVSDYWYKSATDKVVPYPYEGQVLATVIDGVVNVYSIALDAEGNFITQEIGAKVEVDGTTIVKDADGKLSIVAPVNPDEKKTYNFAYANGVYSWVEVDTATAAGQAQAIQGLTDRTVTLEETVNGKGEGEAHVAGLVEKVAALEAIDNATQAELDAYKEVVTGAIAEALQAAKDYADENDADTIYDDTDVKARIKAIEDDYLKEADKYDDTEVRELISDLDKAIGDTENGLVKDIADNKTAIATEKTRAEAAEKALGERIDAIDFVDETELDNAITTALDPVNAEIAKKAAQADLEALEGRVDAFLTGTGATDALDSLQELITYINEHDDVELADIIADVEALQAKVDTGDQKVSEYVTAAIEAIKIGDYAKASDLIALAGRVEALEAKPFDTYATKTEVQDVDAKFADYTKTSDLNTQLAAKADADKVVSNDTFETFKTDNTTAIGAAKDAAIAAAKTETEAQVGALETEVAQTYATKGELTEAVEGIENDLLEYAKSADVNTELAKKVESATIAHAVAADPDRGVEAIPEGVTKDGTTLKIVVDAPTRAETIKMIADKVADVTGGESAADVKLSLEAEVTRSTAKDEAHDAAIAKLTGEATVVGSVAEAKALAQKGVDDAAQVASDLDAAELLIAANGREIETVKGTITTVNETLSGKVTALENKDTEIAGLISGLDTTVKGHTTTITEHGTKLTALENEDARLAALIQGNTDKFTGYYTKGEVDTKVQEAIDQIPAVDFTPYATNEYVNTELAKKADASVVYTKEEADTTFMTEGEVDARINALIVAADPEGGRTITNIQNLVKYVDENAADIAALVTTVDSHSAKFAGLESDDTVVSYVTSSIDTAIKAIIQPKASAEISVAADGTLGINEMNVNKLVQTKGDTLVLNGGNAGTKAAE